MGLRWAQISVQTAGSVRLALLTRAELALWAVPIGNVTYTPLLKLHMANKQILSSPPLHQGETSLLRGGRPRGWSSS